MQSRKRHETFSFSLSFFSSIFFVFGKVEINFTVNAHNQVCVAMPPWTWQHDRVDGGSPWHGACKKLLQQTDKKMKCFSADLGAAAAAVAS